MSDNETDATLGSSRDNLNSVLTAKKLALFCIQSGYPRIPRYEDSWDACHCSRPLMAFDRPWEQTSRLGTPTRVMSHSAPNDPMSVFSWKLSKAELWIARSERLSARTVEMRSLPPPPLLPSPRLIYLEINVTVPLGWGGSKVYSFADICESSSPVTWEKVTFGTIHSLFNGCIGSCISDI